MAIAQTGNLLALRDDEPVPLSLPPKYSWADWYSTLSMPLERENDSCLAYVESSSSYIEGMDSLSTILHKCYKSGCHNNLPTEEEDLVVS